MNKILSKFLKIGTLVSVFLLIGTVLLQIFARFFLASAPSWTEEVSRLFFIFSVAFSATLALKSNYFIFIDFVYNKMGTQSKKVIDLIVLIGTFILFLIIAITSIDFISNGFLEKSPSLGISMGVVFSSIFILGVFICYICLVKLIKQLKNFRS